MTVAGDKFDVGEVGDDQRSIRCGHPELAVHQVRCPLGGRVGDRGAHRLLPAHAPPAVTAHQPLDGGLGHRDALASQIGPHPHDPYNDSGAQYTTVAFTEHLADEGIFPSIGTVGDSYDNALAESVNALTTKNELVDYGARHPGMAELSQATAEWVSWYNRERPNTDCCDLIPDRAEELHSAQTQPHQPQGSVTS